MPERVHVSGVCPCAWGDYHVPGGSPCIRGVSTCLARGEICVFPHLNLSLSLPFAPPSREANLQHPPEDG